MDKLKPIDCKLLFELIKDSHRSDRQIAEAIRTSQPTVKRRRQILEKTIIQEYTVMPKIDKLGFEILAFTLVKSALKYATLEAKKTAVSKGQEWIMKQTNVIFAASGQGMGLDGLAVSLHKDYSDYRTFVQRMKSETVGMITEIESFITQAKPERVIKRLSLTYLADSNAF
jgi:DNA-binding Lrp family transcriptional regulator